MSDTLSLNGLTPARRWGSASNSTGTNMYDIQSGNATAMFTGDLVYSNSGTLKLVSAGDGTYLPIGVFQGCEYTAPNGTPTWSPYWPAAQATLTSATAIGYVVDDPYATFFVQADAAVSADELNTFNYEVTVGVSGSTITGRSNSGLDAASKTAGIAAMLRPIAYEQVPGNSQSSAYPRLECILINHQLRAVSAS